MKSAGSPLRWGVALEKSSFKGRGWWAGSFWCSKAPNVHKLSQQREPCILRKLRTGEEADWLQELGLPRDIGIHFVVAFLFLFSFTKFPPIRFRSKTEEDPRYKNTAIRNRGDFSTSWKPARIPGTHQIQYRKRNNLVVLKNVKKHKWLFSK